jgi:hypothetical protein
MGSDDRLHPNFVNNMVEAISEFPDVFLIHPYVNVIDENGLDISTAVDYVKRLLFPKSDKPRNIKSQSLAVNNVPWVFNAVTGDYMKIPDTTGGYYSYSYYQVHGDGEKVILVYTSNNNIYVKIINCNITAGTYSISQQTSLLQYNSNGCEGIIRQNADTFDFITFIQGNPSVYAYYSYDVPSNTIVYKSQGGGIGISVSYGSGFGYNGASYITVDNVQYFFMNSQMIPTTTTYGCTYTGGNYVWSKEDLNSIELPNNPTSPIFSHSSFTSLVNNLVFNPENAGGFNSNLQFKVGENFMVSHGPGMIKTNLQTATFYAAHYWGDLKKIIKSISIPSGSPYTFTIDQAPTGATPIADFKCLETYAPHLIVNHSSEGNYLQVASNPTTMQYSVVETTGVFTFSSADAGKPLTITYYYLERH